MMDEPTSELTALSEASVQEVAISVIRPELNLEKWPALWEPARSRRTFKTRILERRITLEDGTDGIARIRIAPSTEGTLTTEEQRHFYGLIRLWEENGRVVEEATYFSLRGLARVLKKKWGTRTVQTMTESLSRLLATTIFWENAYFDRTTGEIKKELHGFHILEELYLAHTTKEGRITHDACYFRFNTLILNNLLANYTKPVLLDTVLSFQSEIAQILYTYLDLILYNKDLYKRRSRELFQDLGLDGAAYANVSDRKRTLERIFPELKGVPLTSGSITDIQLELTVDGKDYNLVVRKSRSRPQSQPKSKPVVLTDQPSALRTQGDDEATLAQIRFFYDVFFKSGKTAQPTEKELLHARDHVKRYGRDGAQFLVVFAQKEAPKTGFQIQNYGGITVYESRAAKAYEIESRRKNQVQREESRKGHQDRYRDDYHRFLKETLSRMETEHPEAFVAFLDHDAQERSKYVKQKLNVYLKTDFDTEMGRIVRFADYFLRHAVHPVPDFWEWDQKFNPHMFESKVL